MRVHGPERVHHSDGRDIAARQALEERIDLLGRAGGHRHHVAEHVVALVQRGIAQGQGLVDLVGIGGDAQDPHQGVGGGTDVGGADAAHVDHARQLHVRRCEQALQIGFG